MGNTFGPKAMTLRSACMENIGWLSPGTVAEEDDWKDCLITLQRAGCTYMQLSFTFGLISQVVIQQDFRRLRLITERAETRGGDRHSRVYVIANLKGTMRQHCQRYKMKYTTVYTRMRNGMDKGMTREHALAAALGVDPGNVVAPPVKKRKSPIKKKNDPRGMSKRQRAVYLASVAKKYKWGKWREERRIAEKKKRDAEKMDNARPKTSRQRNATYDFSSLICGDDMLNGYGGAI